MLTKLVTMTKTHKFPPQAFVSMAAAAYMEPGNSSGLLLTKAQSSWFGKCKRFYDYL